MIVLLLAFLLAFFGVGQVTPDVLEVTVDPPRVDLVVGEETTLTATVRTIGGASEEVRWSSSDPSIARVDARSGAVTSVGPGTVEIRATSADDALRFGTVAVTVVAGPSVVGVEIAPSALALAVGASATLDARVDVVGEPPTTLRWFVDDPTVVELDAAGDVTVTGLRPGTAVVTAVSEAAASRADSIRVTVSDDPLPTLGEVTATVRPGSRLELAWAATEADGIDVQCANALATDLASLPGSSTGTTIALPDSTCGTIRVRARLPAGSSEATVALRHVVTTGRDAVSGGEPIPGSLRAVLATAEPGAVIGFAADVRDVALVAKSFSGPHDAHLVLNRDVTLSAPEGTPVTIRSDASLPDDAAGVAVLRTRVLYVPEDVSVRLERLVVRDGAFTSSGGAIRNAGDLTIVDSILEANRAHYRGGAIHNLGSLRIEDSILRGNRALVTDAELAAAFACIDDVRRACAEDDEARLSFGQGGSGGAIYQEAGGTQLVRTVVRGNLAAYSGGGVYVEAGTLELTDSELVENTASDAGASFDTYSFGGGIANFSRDGVALTGGEVRGNVSSNVGGGIANGSNRLPDLPMTLRDVLVTENRAGDFGGGLIHYVARDRASLRELGATEVVGNVAGAGMGGGDGDDRSISQAREAEDR